MQPRVRLWPASVPGATALTDQPVPTQPNLAGMSGTYIAKQLQHFKTGQRDNAIMKGFAANLSADDMKDLGAYFAAKPARPIGTKDEAGENG